MNRQEKIILAIITLVVFLVGGFFIYRKNKGAEIASKADRTNDKEIVESIKNERIRFDSDNKLSKKSGLAKKLAKDGANHIEAYLELAEADLGINERNSCYWLEDFDGDNNFEFFVAKNLGTTDHPDIEMYYINTDKDIYLLNGKYLPEKLDYPVFDVSLNDAGDEWYLFIRLNSYGPGSKTYILGAKDNKPYSPDISGQVDTFYPEDDHFVHSFTYLEDTDNGSYRAEGTEIYYYDQETRQFVLDTEVQDY
uniref:hypothetical protein n=1 Tax=Anaerococcus mediterraneensis TaxID=1870984 RepID=UPI00093048C9|nr:hypothetical protein [Anaerococcus mediterraneensis]